MSNPETAAAQDPNEQQKTNKESFQEQVTSALNELKKDDDTGKYVFPEDLSDEVRFAADAERRRWDTQSAYSKNQQQVKALEAENEKLKALATSSVGLSLTEDEKEELDELKFSDPEAWRAKMNDLDSNKANSLSTQFEEISTEAGKAAELERREQLLTAYNAQHPGAELTDDVIANDIPPRITKRLEDGEISFEDFLIEVNNYSKDFKVGQESLNSPTNMGNVGGGSTVSEASAKEDIVLSYANEIF